MIAAIRGLNAGETISSVSPDDGRLALDTSKRNLIIGMSALSAGAIAATLTTSAGRTLGMTINVVSAPALPTPTLFESFDTFDGTTANGLSYGTGATLALDTSDKVQGTASIDIQPDSGTSANASVGYDRTPATSYDPTAQGVQAIYVKTIDNSLMTGVSLTVFRGGTSNQISPSEPQPGRYPLRGKWIAFDFATAFPLVAAAGSGTLRRRLGVTGGSGTGRRIKGDAWVSTAKGRTIVVIDGDDGYKSQMLQLLKLMQDRGLKLNLQVEFSKLTGNGSGSNQRLSPADIDYMASQGVRIFSQVDGDDLTLSSNYATTAAALDRMDAVAAALVANGWSTAAQAKHISFPYGAWNEALIAGMKARGYLTGRSVQPLGNYTRFG